jgi:glycogen synthase
LIIVHLSDSYYPTIGGLERSIRTLANHQHKDGHEVHIITSSHPDRPSYEDDSGVKIHRIKMATQVVGNILEDPRRPFHITAPDPIFQSGLKRILLEIKPNVVHSHGWSTYSLIPIAKKLNIPVVSTSHDYGHFCVVKQFVMEDGNLCSGPELKKCIKHASSYYGAVKGIPLSLGMTVNVNKTRYAKWTALNESAASAANGTSYEIKDIEVIPSYIPDENLTIKSGHKPEFLPTRPYILFVGGLTKSKGLHLLLEAFKVVKASNPELELVLIGMPKNDTPKDFPDGVTIIKNQPNDIVMQAWKHAAVGVVPSLLPEAFGQVAVECIAAGTPVIVSNHGGLKDIVTDEVGSKIEPGNLYELVEEISRILEDKTFKDKVSVEGPKRASLFTVSAIYPKIMDAYRKVIKN